MHSPCVFSNPLSSSSSLSRVLDFARRSFYPIKPPSDLGQHFGAKSNPSAGRNTLTPSFDKVSCDGKTYARNVLSSQYQLCHSKTIIILSTVIKNSHSLTPQTQDNGWFACTNMHMARTGHRPAVRYVAFRQGLLDSDPRASERRAVDQTFPHDIETENLVPKITWNKDDNVGISALRNKYNADHTVRYGRSAAWWGFWLAGLESPL